MFAGLFDPNLDPTQTPPSYLSFLGPVAEHAEMGSQQQVGPVRSKKKVLFIRGLNTMGDDLMHLGPISLGPHDYFFKHSLARYGYEVVSVKGMGAGRLEKHVERAIDFYQNHPLAKSNEPFHIIGHSAGGLIAREFLHRFEQPERILSFISLASPHNGAFLADKAVNFRNNNPALYHVCKAFNYDFDQRAESFIDLTPENVHKLNERHKHLNFKSSSITFSIPLHEMSLPLGVVNARVRTYRRGFHSDGIVERQSQAYGEVLGHYELDHLTQLGYFLYVYPWWRKEMVRRYLSMVETVVKYLDRFETKNA
jgi:pimeloyl-ACP methyl ester carboxylesterase